MELEHPEVSARDYLKFDHCGDKIDLNDSNFDDVIERLKNISI
jgi:hypothetical protein